MIHRLNFFVWFVGVTKACFTCPVFVPFFKVELFAFKKSMESFQQFRVFKSSVSMAQDFEEDLHVNCNMFVRLCKCRVTNSPYRIYVCIAWGGWSMSRLDDIGYTATYMLSVIGTPLSWGKALEFDLPACWWSEKCVCFQILISESLLNICLCLQYSSFFSAITYSNHQQLLTFLLRIGVLVGNAKDIDATLCQVPLFWSSPDGPLEIPKFWESPNGWSVLIRVDSGWTCTGNVQPWKLEISDHVFRRPKPWSLLVLVDSHKGGSGAQLPVQAVRQAESFDFQNVGLLSLKMRPGVGVAAHFGFCLQRGSGQMYWRDGLVRCWDLAGW